MRQHSIIALVLLGVMTLGCARMEIPDQVGNDVTLTTTVSLGGAPASLSSVTCLATTFASDATKDWLTGVASGGTFYRSEGVDWSGGDSGIPSGWTIVDYVAP